MFHVFAVHGIGTSEKDALVFHDDVMRVLGELVDPSKVKVTLGRWRSTGKVFGDVWRIGREHVHMVDDLMPAFDQWLEECWEDPDARMLLLGHSFGTILARILAAMSPAHRCRLLCLGSPAHHPVFRLALPRMTAIAGMRCIAVVNNEDGVCAIAKRYHAFPDWGNIRIAFSARPPKPDRDYDRLVAGIEHDPWSYLTHPLVLEELRSAAR